MESLIIIYSVIADAINSSKLIENLPMSAGGNLYCQANPSELNLPIPYLHASDIMVPVGSVNIDTFGADFFRNPIHR